MDEHLSRTTTCEVRERSSVSLSAPRLTRRPICRIGAPSSSAAIVARIWSSTSRSSATNCRDVMLGSTRTASACMRIACFPSSALRRLTKLVLPTPSQPLDDRAGVETAEDLVGDEGELPVAPHEQRDRARRLGGCRRVEGLLEQEASRSPKRAQGLPRWSSAIRCLGAWASAQVLVIMAIITRTIKSGYHGYDGRAGGRGGSALVNVWERLPRELPRFSPDPSLPRRFPP